MEENKYIFKHNEKGDLYYYVELDKKGKTNAYYFFSANTLIRYDKTQKQKHYVKYKEGQDIVLLQRFEAGESWITIALRPEKTFEETKKENEDFEEYFKNNVTYRFQEYYHNENLGNASCQNLGTPKKEKEFIFKNNCVERFKINKDLVEKWSEIINA